MNNKNIYKLPESELLKENCIKYKHKLIKTVLIVILLSKLTALNLTIGILFPVELEGVTIITDYFQASHLIAYFIVSTICIVGILFRKVIFFYGLLFIFLINLGVYAINDTSTFQSISDPILITVFLFLVYFVKPNKWHQIFMSDSTQN